MKIEYVLSTDDFLQHQLYLCNHSDRIIAKRKRTRIVVPLIYIGFAIFFLVIQAQTLSIVFILVAVLWFIFYPRYESKKYFRHYRSHIEEQYSKMTNKPVSMELKEDHLFATDTNGEAKLKLDQFEKIIEIKNNFLIKLATGNTIVLPKTGANIDANSIRSFAEAIAEKSGLQISNELDWKWF